GGQRVQPLGTFRGGPPRVHVVEDIVEDVVGAAGEPVQRVYGGPLLRGEQPGGQEEGPAVFGVEPAAAAVGVPQGGVVHTGGVQFGADHVRTTRWSRRRV